ncbi:MAG: FGGY-family carbohydrate kinase [Cyanobacteriota bacterium]|nr:FGGY-family carbohydrate kinase [Cyanobacteriota bacterium]
MPAPDLGLGVDLGSSGLRLALASADASAGQGPLWQTASPYPGAFEDPCSWWQGLLGLCQQIPADLRPRVGAVAVDGTSGTLLLCRPDGSLLAGTLALALPYHQACLEHSDAARDLACADPARNSDAAASASGSLARALRLLQQAPTEPLLLRHQADWLMGRLLGDWRFGEASNNLRLGWLQGDCPGWAGAIGRQRWSNALPQVINSGCVAGRLHPGAAAALGLPAAALVVAGCTDASAAVLAADAGPADGITVLGTTLVLKQWSQQPIAAAGVSSQQLGGRWLVGGASNAGCGVLRQFFDDDQLQALSRQIDPNRPSGLALRPLPGVGERFPIDDPTLEPLLEPRPVSDARYLQALLEGLAAIEAAGWQRLRQLGAPAVQRVISLGGGASNPQWRAIRQRQLGIPVLNRPQLSAALGMARLAAHALPTAPHG